MRPRPRLRTLLVLSQVYPPDPASVGQHTADAAAEMVRRGYRVVVLTADRGYDDPTVRYPHREVLDGVDVRRLPFSSLGKKSIPIRVLGGLLFLFQAIPRGLCIRGLVCVLVSTSPPMCAAASLVIGTIRRRPMKYWVMDLNPDQAVALGGVRPDAVSVRIFDWFNRWILGCASDVITLDRFMAERLLRKRDVHAKLAVLPPWPHDDHLEVVPHELNPFRARHGLEGKFVIMYSGNHGPSNPVSTVLDAAILLQDDTRIEFLFIGGGIGKREVEASIRAGVSNVRSLPYQPLADIKYSLSAADVHVVTVGTAIVGMCHPCKVYGAMAVARPILLLGPRPCHVTDLLDQRPIGWHVDHGNVDALVSTIRRIAATPSTELAAMGSAAKDLISRELGKDTLCRSFCDILERGVRSA